MMYKSVLSILLLIKLNEVKNTDQFLSRTRINYVPWWQFKVDASLLIYVLILSFGCPIDNFGPLSRGKPHSSNVNHGVIQVLTQSWPRALWQSWAAKPGRALSSVWIGNFLILSQRLNPLGHASWLVVIKVQFLSLFTLTLVYYIFQNYNTFKFIYTFPFVKHSKVSYFLYSVDAVKRHGYNF